MYLLPSLLAVSLLQQAAAQLHSAISTGPHRSSHGLKKQTKYETADSAGRPSVESVTEAVVSAVLELAMKGAARNAPTAFSSPTQASQDAFAWSWPSKTAQTHALRREGTLGLSDATSSRAALILSELQLYARALHRHAFSPLHLFGAGPQGYPGSGLLKEGAYTPTITKPPLKSVSEQRAGRRSGGQTKQKAQKQHSLSHAVESEERSPGCASLLKSLGQVHAELGAATGALCAIEWDQQQYLPLTLEPGSLGASQEVGGKPRKQQRQQPSAPVAKRGHRAGDLHHLSPAKLCTEQEYTQAQEHQKQRQKEEQQQGRRRARDHSQPPRTGAASTALANQEVDFRGTAQCGSSCARRSASLPTWVRASPFNPNRGPTASEVAAVPAVTTATAKTRSDNSATDGIAAAAVLVNDPWTHTCLSTATSQVFPAATAGEGGSIPMESEDPAAKGLGAAAGEVVATSRRRPPYLQRMHFCVERLQPSSGCSRLPEQDWQRQLLQYMQQQLELLQEQQQSQQAILRQHFLLQQQLQQPVDAIKNQQKASDGASGGAVESDLRQQQIKQQQTQPLHSEGASMTPKGSPKAACYSTAQTEKPQQQKWKDIEAAADGSWQKATGFSPQSGAQRRVQHAGEASRAALPQARWTAPVCTADCQHTSRKCAACHPEENTAGQCFGVGGSKVRSSASPSSRQEQRQRPKQKSKEQQEPQLLVLALPCSAGKEVLVCSPASDGERGRLHISEQQQRSLMQLIRGRMNGNWKLVEESASDTTPWGSTFRSSHKQPKTSASEGGGKQHVLKRLQQLSGGAGQRQAATAT
ncbi:uncharacterized protein LOC34622311 [Cyclospora cayetanensis]|uniref:Uncharacterized protein LOC34622311 n=1 Tax=Cyclospora cayetanensis TaxID=88456 RepID=A0A6P6S073_9EIME|nr:uncharacterized protein LOC34622311 [Cyclospora cayetanensis]